MAKSPCVGEAFSDAKLIKKNVRYASGEVPHVRDVVENADGEFRVVAVNPSGVLMVRTEEYRIYRILASDLYLVETDAM